jgi:hypothetical protein
MAEGKMVDAFKAILRIGEWKQNVNKLLSLI